MAPIRTRGPQVHVQIDVVRGDDVQNGDVSQVVDRVDLFLLTHMEDSVVGSPEHEVFGLVGSGDDVERHAQVGKVREAVQPGVHGVQLRVGREDGDGEGTLPALHQSVHVGKTVHARVETRKHSYEVCVT